MASKIYFKETQSFRQIWTWLFLLALDGLFIFAFIHQVILKIPIGDNPAPNALLIFLLIITLSLNALFLSLKLETEITEEGIRFLFFPFHTQFQLQAWKDIKFAYTREYKPLREFGGWGLRYSLSGNKTAYNVSGNKGLQIILNNDYEILYGTQKPDEINKALQQLWFEHPELRLKERSV